MTQFLRASYTVQLQMGIYLQVKAWYCTIKGDFRIYFTVFFLYLYHIAPDQGYNLLITAVLFFCMSASDSFSYARHTCALWCYGAVIRTPISDVISSRNYGVDAVEVV